MEQQTTYSGFAIALAWPQTYCKQAGAWYDGLLKLLRISKNNYYKVGHAALVLIDKEVGECRYFDFGRYHAPLGFGRVRSADTDTDLQMLTKATTSANRKTISNIDEILTELQSKEAYHGDGLLYASIAEINFATAHSKAISMQEESPIVYGPFEINGTNCSRFVNTIIKAGKPRLSIGLKLNFLLPLTPTPILNVTALGKVYTKDKPQKYELLCPLKKSKNQLRNTLSAPEKHELIPRAAQWLSGEGAGSWFFFNNMDSVVEIIRYSAKGKIECKGIYNNSHKIDFTANSFEIVHLSNCKQVSVLKNKTKFVLERLN